MTASFSDSVISFFTSVLGKVVEPLKAGEAAAAPVYGTYCMVMQDVLMFFFLLDLGVSFLIARRYPHFKNIYYDVHKYFGGVHAVLVKLFAFYCIRSLVSEPTADFFSYGLFLNLFPLAYVGLVIYYCVALVGYVRRVKREEVVEG